MIELDKIYVYKFCQSTKNDDLEKQYRAYAECGFINKEDYSEKRKKTFAYTNAIMTCSQEKCYSNENNICGIEYPKYSPKALDQIRELQMSGLYANQEFIREDFAFVKLCGTPDIDMSVAIVHFSKVMRDAFGQAVDSFKRFVEETAELHSRQLLASLKLVCPKLKTSKDTKVRQKGFFRDISKELGEFSKSAGNVICNNYGLTITWAIMSNHFSKEKFASQLRCDMYYDHQSTEVQRNYILSTLRKDSSRSKHIAFAVKFVQLYVESNSQ
jgi:hypothetical protein